MQMQVESAKRRFKVETLKAEARRDDELARIDEEQELLEEESYIDCPSFAEKVDNWEVAVSNGDRRDVKNQTDNLTKDKRTDGQTPNWPENSVIATVQNCVLATVGPIPGHVSQATCPPFSRPPEDAKKAPTFCNDKPFFAQNAPGDASQSATHKVVPSNAQVPEGLKEFFQPNL